MRPSLVSFFWFAKCLSSVFSFYFAARLWVVFPKAYESGVLHRDDMKPRYFWSLRHPKPRGSFSIASAARLGSQAARFHGGASGSGGILTGSAQHWWKDVPEFKPGRARKGASGRPQEINDI